MQIHKYIRELLFLLFVVYFAQGSLYQSSSIISKAALLLIFLISGFYLVKTLLIKSRNNQFFIAWTLLLLLNVIGFVFANFGVTPHVAMFKRILGCMLPFYPFYFFAIRNHLKSSHLVRFLLMMIPVIILQFFFNRTQVLLELGEDDATNMVNNVAYTFVRLMPFVFLIKKKKILSFLLMLLMCIFVVQGAKRGAMISAGLILIVYYYFQMRTVERRNRFFGYILALAGVLVLSFFVYRYFMENEFLIRRMVSISNGDTSGRTVLYSRIWEGWSGSHNLLNLLFGYGFAASIYLTGLNEAHNDWLELLSNFGLLGVTTYLYLFYSAVKSMLNPTWLPDKKILMFTVVLVWFFISLISMWYVSLSGYTQAILLAYLVGSRENSLD